MRREIKRWLPLSFVFALAACGLLGSGAETLTSFPSGTFLENLRIGDNNEVYLTNYFERKIEVWKEGEGAKTFTQLPLHPVSLIETTKGLLVFGHGMPFNAGPQFQGTNGMVLIDRNGTAGPVIQFPEARFLNGCTPFGPDKVLVADSIQGVIWQVNVTTMRVSMWFNSIELRPNMEQEPFKPGANGVQRGIDGGIYISNSSSGKIWRIGVATNFRPEGVLQQVTQLPSVDDFMIDMDGTIYAASNDKQVWKIKPAFNPYQQNQQGQPTYGPQPAPPQGFEPRTTEERTALLDGLDNATAVAIGVTVPANEQGPDIRSLYVVTAGNALTGGGGTSGLYRIKLGPIELSQDPNFQPGVIPPDKPR